MKKFTYEDHQKRVREVLQSGQQKNVANPRSLLDRLLAKKKQPPEPTV